MHNAYPSQNTYSTGQNYIIFQFFEHNFVKVNQMRSNLYNKHLVTSVCKVYEI